MQAVNLDRSTSTYKTGTWLFAFTWKFNTMKTATSSLAVSGLRRTYV